MAKKSFLDSIEVPAPCEKSWDEMVGGEEIRFCAGCQKNVHNISAMPRPKARRLVAENAGKICIRYTRLPNGKVMTDENRLHQISRRTSAVAAGVIAATLTLSAMTYAQNEPTTETNSAVSQKHADQKSKSVSFAVEDQMGAVIPDVRVTLTNQKTNQVFSLTTNDEGIAAFASIPDGKYLVNAKSSMGGFSEHNQTLEINEKTTPVIKIILKVKTDFVMGDFTIEPADSPKINAPSSNKRRNKNISETSQISFTIYDPNNQVIPGVRVQLTNQKTKAEFNAVTDQTGIARFGLIPHGRYDVLVSSSIGFKNHRQVVQIKELIEPNIKITLDIGIFTGLVVIDWSEIPLFQAISQKDNEAVKQLINSGFDVNTKDSRKETALHVAAEHGNLEIVRFLLEKGAKVNAKDRDNRSPLLMLVENSDAEETTNLEILRLLIAKGANVNARDEEKKTLLMSACEDDNLEVVKMLLEAKADPNLKDEDGETAFQKTDSDEIKRLLTSYGARQN